MQVCVCAVCSVCTCAHVCRYVCVRSVHVYSMCMCVCVQCVVCARVHMCTVCARVCMRAVCMFKVCACASWCARVLLALTPAHVHPPGSRPSPARSGGSVCWTYPEVALAGRALGHIHPAPLGLQVLVEGLVQREAVHQVAAHVQAVGLSSHLHGDVLPLGVSQAHVLQGDDVLGAVHPVGEVQGVRGAVGHDLELPVCGARALQRQQGAPGPAVLLQAGRQEEALLVPHGLGDPAQVLRAHRRDVVKADEAVGGHAGVWAPELLGPDGLAVDVADAEEVEGGVLLLVSRCSGSRARRSGAPGHRALLSGATWAGTRPLRGRRARPSFLSWALPDPPSRPRLARERLSVRISRRAFTEKGSAVRSPLFTSLTRAVLPSLLPT